MLLKPDPTFYPSARLAIGAADRQMHVDTGGTVWNTISYEDILLDCGRR